MTREEIRERADNIVEVLILSTSPSFVTAHVQSKLLSLVRATLEEAARAVCEQCAKGGEPITNEATPEWWHPGDSDSCPASRIHDLIAALDKEAKGEG